MIAENEKDRLIEWLLGNDTGISSKQIAAVMVGIEPRDKWHAPCDPGDFGRCMRLLALFPNWSVNNMKGVSDDWDSLLSQWGHLEDLWHEEKDGFSAPKLYKKMQELLKD